MDTNWDGGVAPVTDTFDAIVGAPSPTIFDGNLSINSLTVGADGVLQTSGNFNFGGTATTTLSNAGSISVGNNSDFQLSGTVDNSGSITANFLGGSVNSDLEVVGGGATVSGGGIITLSGSNARVSGLSGAVLTLDDQTIQGDGQIGANSVGLVLNSGATIDANSAAGDSLILDSSTADGVSNQGTIKSSGGGNLFITGSTVNNAGGSIEAGTGSTVSLQSSTIVRGTISGDGAVNVVDNTSVDFEGLTQSGSVAVGNNSDLDITGTIDNTGSISLNFTGGSVNSDLEVQADGVTLDGGGTVTLNGANARVVGTSGSDLNIANQTIQGDGQIGANLLTLTNSATSLIDANSSENTLTVDAAGSGFAATAGATNLGTIRASSGGTLRLSDSTIDNTNGSIQSLAGSDVEFVDSTIIGGTISGTGEIDVLDGTTVNFTNLTQAGSVAVGNNSDLDIAGAINNTGSISLNFLSGSVNSDLEVQASATLDGGGTVTLNGVNARVVGTSGSDLTIANQTIQGEGQIGANTLTFTNSGLIDANSAGNTLNVNPAGNGSGNSVADAGVINLATIQASGGGTLRFTDSTIDNTAGSILSLVDSKVEFTDSTIIGGTISGVGEIDVLDSTTVNFTNLTQAGDVAVGNNSDLDITGTINNTGSISLNFTGGSVFSDLEVQADGAILNGGGTVTLSGSNARLTGVSGSDLTIADQTIQGDGQIGANLLNFNNAATNLIDANSSGNTLTVDAAGVGINAATAGATNFGTIRASNGGTLLFSDSTIDNTNGSIQSLAGSEVEFTDSTIIGGTISGSGEIDVLDSTTVNFTNLTQAGDVAVGNNSDLDITGTINNTGSISLNFTGGSVNSDLEVQTSATLDGGGTVTLNGGNARVVGISGSDLNIANQTIQGDGQIGANLLTFTNSATSLIDANFSENTLTVDATGVGINATSAGATNLGTIQASSGGTLLFSDSTIDNTNGSILSLAGSEVEFTDSTIIGGTISGVGEIDVLDGTTVNFTNLTQAGDVAVGNNSDLEIAGAINNTGSISLNFTGGSVDSDLEVQTNATLDGGGVVTLSGARARVTGISGSTLNIADQTIQGFGQVGTNILNLSNSPNGLIRANVAGQTLTVDIAGSNGWVNDGTLEASNDGILDLAQGLVNNGTLQGNSTINIDGGLNNSGIIGPGLSPGNLTINTDNVSLTSLSELIFEIEGAEFGEFDTLDFNFLNDDGKLFLDGLLQVDLNGFVPDQTDEFTLLTADNFLLLDGPDILGSFSNVADGDLLTTVGGEGTFVVNYGGTDFGNQVRLSNFVATAVPEPSASGLLVLVGLGLVSRRKRNG